MTSDHDCNASVDDTQARVEAPDSPMPPSPPPGDLPDISLALETEEASTLDMTKETMAIGRQRKR